MSKLDEIKTSKQRALEIKIDLLKNIFNSLFVSFFGVIAYLVINFEQIAFAKLLVIIAGAVIILITIVCIVLMLSKKIKDLEEM
ncbi:MAG: hypothetical protein LBG21_01175 [Campylobacteraceae bacterium]|jgi:hypothetical protein|nr:hypothetical protein [Campylobacteraceae bacterium]